MRASRQKRKPTAKVKTLRSDLDRDTSADSGDKIEDTFSEAAPASGRRLRQEGDQESRGRSRAGRAPVTRTQQAPPELHEIYEYQLEDLLRLRRDGFSDAMAAAMGAAVALFPTCLESLVGYFVTTPPTPFTALHLSELIIFGAACAVAAVTWKVSERRNTRAREIATQVRGQRPT